MQDNNQGRLHVWWFTNESLGIAIFVLITLHLFAIHEDADIDEMAQKEHHFAHPN